jgi:hypothetical protein
MKTITILIAGLMLLCTSVLKAQVATANSLVSVAAPSTAWTPRPVTDPRKLQATIFTGDHRLYWKYRVPIAYGAKPLDKALSKRPTPTLVIEPLCTRRSALPDIMLFSGMHLSKAHTAPTWREWLLPRTVPTYWDHWRTSEITAAHVDLVLFEF